MSYVFISYAREDAKTANRLYGDLTKAGYSVWLDKKNILGGQKWKAEISKAISESFAFIAVISQTSISKTGYVQRELRYAFDVLSQLPANQIYVLPVRLQPVVPEFDELRELSWIDLFDGYAAGLRELKKSLHAASGSRKTPVALVKAPQAAERSFEEAVREAIRALPGTSELLAEKHPFHIRFLTQEKGVVLPSGVKKAYPHNVLIVLQHQYRELNPTAARFSVSLWFNDVETKVVVPYRAVLSVSGRGVSLERSAER